MRFGCVLLAVMILTATDLRAESVKPVVNWSGTVKELAKQKALPEHGLVVDQKGFVDLWKAWRPNEEAPQVDFSTHFVVVRTAEGRFTFIAELQVDENGAALLLTARGSTVYVEGFGYGLAVFPRDKVKTFAGRPIKRD